MAISGLNKLMEELDWLSGGYETTLSSAINDFGYEGAEEMEDTMARDTGWLKSSVYQTDGFLFTEFGSRGTTYALFNDGAIPITSRPYTPTPFFLPTVQWVNENVGDVVSNVISQKRGA